MLANHKTQLKPLEQIEQLIIIAWNVQQSRYLETVRLIEIVNVEMDIDDAPQGKGEETKEKPIVVILVGAPGSGKSTFGEQVMRSSTRPWVRICQVCLAYVR